MAEPVKAFNLNDHLMTHLKNEIEGFNNYVAMAEIAEEKGEDDLCEYLMEMAEDEYSHARFIYKYAKERCCSISDECKEKYKCMESKYMSFFR